MAKVSYEDFEIGDTGRSAMGRTISESDMYFVSGLTGSYNPIHTDREYMKNTKFGRPIVQNTLLITVMEGLIKRIPEWDPDIVAAYGRDDIRFVTPVFVGDTVTLVCEVVDKRRKGESRGVISFKQDLYNQDETLVVTGKYLLLVTATE